MKGGHRWTWFVYFIAKSYVIIFLLCSPLQKVFPFQITVQKSQQSASIFLPKSFTLFRRPQVFRLRSEKSYPNQLLKDTIIAPNNQTRTLLNLIDLGNRWFETTWPGTDIQTLQQESDFHRVEGCDALVKIKAEHRSDDRHELIGFADAKVALGLLAYLSTVSHSIQNILTFDTVLVDSICEV
jgi:hypothetical protein